MNKKKGIAAERELLHLLFDKGWMAVRVAGSGSMPEPSCDLLVGNVKRRYAIECKTSRKVKKYLSKAQVREFEYFAKHFGLTPVIAIKFMHNGWHFIEPSRLRETEKGIAIHLEDVQEHGKSFEQFVG